MIHTAVKEANRKKIPVFRRHNSSGASLEGMLQELEAAISCAAIGK